MFCLSKSKSKDKLEGKAENNTFSRMINNFFDMKPASPAREPPKSRLISPAQAQGSDQLKTLLQNKAQKNDMSAGRKVVKDNQTLTSGRQNSPQASTLPIQKYKNSSESNRNVIGVAERLHTQNSLKGDEIKQRHISITSGLSTGIRQNQQNELMFSATSQNFSYKPKLEIGIDSLLTSTQLFHQKSNPSLNMQSNQPAVVELKIHSDRNFNYISSPFNKKSQKNKSSYYTQNVVDAIKQKNRNPAQLSIKQQESIKHITQTFDAIKIQQQRNEQKIIPQFAKKLDHKKKTIVLDLDETLIHSVLNRNPNQGFHINIRPFVMEFLFELKKCFNIVLWTASERRYSEQILRKIDPSGSIFNIEVYREYCSLGPKNQVLKDIRIFGVPLSQICIVDNSTSTFVGDLDNGIPIFPFFNDVNDQELKELLDFLLMEILPASDVRQVIRRRFRFQEFKNFQSVDHAVQFLYEQGF